MQENRSILAYIRKMSHQQQCLGNKDPVPPCPAHQAILMHLHLLQLEQNIFIPFLFSPENLQLNDQGAKRSLGNLFKITIT